MAGFKKQALAWCLRAFLALLLFLSGVEHLRDQFRFLNSVLNYRIVYGLAAVAFAVLLPSIQIVLSVLILHNRSAKFALALSIAMFALFFVAQLSALARGLDISCGCFGSLREESISMFTLGRTLCFAIVAFFAFKVAESHDVCR